MVVTYEHDYYNEEGRNISNTSQYDYNCGGYALGTFNWYCPYRNDGDHTSHLRMKMSVNDMARYYADFILEDFFGKIREIKSITELLENERAIAFRCGVEDFHFCIRGHNGVWYHKPGCSYIRRIAKTEIFAKEWRSPSGLVYYDSQIILFAIKD